MLVTSMTPTYKGRTEKTAKPILSATWDLRSKLGFILHPVSSVLKPVQVLIFLGFVLNSVDMTISLTLEKILHITVQCVKLLELTVLPIWELASFIGLLVSSYFGVLNGPLFYRHLEINKTISLTTE